MLDQQSYDMHKQYAHSYYQYVCIVCGFRQEVTTLTVVISQVVSLSFSSSIDWDNGEGVLMALILLFRSEGVAGVIDTDTVGAVDLPLLCLIIDMHPVPDVIFNMRHIQAEGSSPKDSDSFIIFLYPHIHDM